MLHDVRDGQFSGYVNNGPPTDTVELAGPGDDGRTAGQSGSRQTLAQAEVALRLPGRLGRVAPAGCPAEAPPDPDEEISTIRLHRGYVSR
jgi:hypothetical protein